jgi:hypothetical protein
VTLYYFRYGKIGLDELITHRRLDLQDKRELGEPPFSSYFSDSKCFFSRSQGYRPHLPTANLLQRKTLADGVGMP